MNHSANTATADPLLDRFVWTKTNNLGVGKLLRVIGGSAEVTYFHNIGHTQTELIRRCDILPVADLPRHTRCYIKNRNGWRVGRIMRRSGGQHPDSYDVQFDLEETRRFQEQHPDFWVRCNPPLGGTTVDDPTPVLRSGGLDRAELHAHRFRLTTALTRQRATGQGLSGLLSSNIRLLPHQIEIVRRVLQDPVQRYLLADEVGLGKTIEAGVVIRQFLLDDPTGRVAVVAPHLLVGQWQEELDNHFYLNDLKPERVLVTGTDDEDLFKREFGLVVIDEAQHVAGLAFARRRQDRERYLAFGELCRTAPQVLLLSATPAKNNEREFLAMLHLLDPHLYSLTPKGVEEFERRVSQRQVVGRLLMGLQGNVGSYTIRQQLGNLAELEQCFQDDSRLRALAVELREVLEMPEPDAARRAALVRAVRVHVSEAYRLHRRLLRNRRGDVVVEGDLAGRKALEGESRSLRLLRDLDPRSKEITGWLEDWRTEANKAPDSDQLAGVYRLLVEAAGSLPSVFRAVVRARRRALRPRALRFDFSRADRDLLFGTPHFPGERSLLEQIEEALQPQANLPRAKRQRQLIRHLLTHRKRCGEAYKCVVFSGYTAVARVIARALRKRFGEKAVATLMRGHTCEDVDADVRRFRDRTSCWLLVCDAAGEEGRNLQFATEVFHLDIPFSPNRLEQRIGRLDRIGRRQTVIATALVGPDVAGESPVRTWFRVLRDGFGVFDQSISSLQFFVNSSLPELVKLLYRKGTTALRDAIPQIRSGIVEERVFLQEQDEVDAIDVSDAGARDACASLLAGDAEQPAVRPFWDQWLRALRFEQLQGLEGTTGHRPLFLPEPNNPKKLDYATLVPLKWVMSRIAGVSITDRPSLFPRNEALDIREKFEQQVGFGTFDRAMAQANPEVRLLRPGNRFVDAIAEYLRWDDPGRVSAVWRTVPNMAVRKQWGGFRFDFVVSADSDRAADELPERGLIGRQAIQRAADGLVPPIVETVFLGQNGASVEDDLLAVVEPLWGAETPEYTEYDLFQSKYRHVLLRLLRAAEWVDECDQARARAMQEVMKRGAPPLSERCAERADRARTAFATRLEQLKLRQQTMADVNLALECRLAELLEDGIRCPRLRIDSVGLIVVACVPPQ